MLDHIVFDVEIAKTIEEVGGWNNTEKMGVAVACLWQHIDQRMRVYGPDDVPALKERLLKADRVSSYNGLMFDCPVVWELPKSEWKLGHPVYDKILPKTNDLLRRIWQALGFDPDKWQPGMGNAKLDNIAQATLGVGKIGNGADAPKWYQAGQIQRVVNYCCDDVCLERDLTDFVDRYGFVIHMGKQLFLKEWKGA